MENANVGTQKLSAGAKLLKRVQGVTTEITPPGAKPVVAAPVAPVAAPEAPAVVSSAPVTEDDYDIEPPVAVEPSEPKKTIPREFLPEDPSDEVDQLMDPKGTTGENFKKLRTKLKSVNQDYRKANEELTELRKKVADFDAGLVVPEITQSQLARISELEVYEKLYNFKKSPVYQEKFAKPIQEEQGKLLELAKEYGVQPEVLNAAFAAQSSVETNRILSQHFKDDVGALEAKSILKNIKKIQNEAFEAEKEPGQTLAKLNAENERIIAEQRTKANEAIKTTSKSAWVESLTHLREDPRFPGLTYREGDTEHNEKIVRPTLQRAATEYGKIVGTLAQHGLTELPKELGVAFARMTQMSHQAAILAVERDQLLQEVKELRGLMQSKTSLSRPGVNSTGGGSNGTTSFKAVGPSNAGRRVLERVQGKA